MAQKTYCGIGNIARQVPDKGYGGDDNEIARKLIKGYCGDSNNIARQFWGDGTQTQEGMSPSADYVAGGTYDFDVCIPVMALKYALDEYQKVNLANLRLYGVYDIYKSIKADIITHFLANKGDANVIKISLSQSTYNGGATYIVVNWDNVNTNNRQISTVTKNVQYGTKYAALAQTIWLSKGVQWTISHTDKSVRHFETSNSLGYIGMRIDQQYSGSYGTGHNLDVSNLGMTMYSVSMIYDWYWNFDSLEQPMVDRVDGLLAFKNNTSSSDPSPDNCIYDKWDYINLPSFLWEKGRTIEIRLGEAERHYEEQDWGKSYPQGALLGIYNTAGYGSTPGIGFDVTVWDRYTTSRLRGRRNYGTVLGSELSTPNQLSGKLLTVYFDEDKITLTTNDGLSAYIDQAPSLANRNYFRIGCVVPVSLGYEALYKFKVRSVAVY